MTPNVMQFKKGGVMIKKAKHGYGGLMQIQLPPETLKSFHDLNPNSRINRLFNEDSGLPANGKSKMAYGGPVPQIRKDGTIDPSVKGDWGAATWKSDVLMALKKHGRIDANTDMNTFDSMGWEDAKAIADKNADIVKYQPGDPKTNKYNNMQFLVNNRYKDPTKAPGGTLAQGYDESGNTVGDENYLPEKKRKGGKVEKVMHEFKNNKLHSGSKKGPLVKTRKQAIAIAMSEAGKNKYAQGGEFENQYSGDDKLMQIEGPSHEEGGVQFSPTAEVEGGETVKSNVVNSNNIIISKEIAEQYGLPKGAVGKTPAQYSKTIEKKYKGRDLDPFAQNSKEMEMNNVTKMSMDLGEMYKQAQQKRNGGKVFDLGGYNDSDNPDGDGIFDKKNLPWNDPDPKAMWPFNSSGKKFINDLYYGKKSNTGINTMPSDTTNVKPFSGRLQLSDILSNPFKRPVLPTNPLTGPEDPNNPSYGQFSNVPEDSNVSQIPTQKNVPAGKGNVSLPDVNMDQYLSSINSSRYNADNYVDPNEQFYTNPPDPIGTGDYSDVAPPPSVEGDFKPVTYAGPGSTNSKGMSGSQLMGLAPMAINAFLAARTAATKPDKVQFGRIQPDEMYPAFIDPTYALNTASDTFGTANEAMKQGSKTDYLRRRIQSATEEGKTKSGILGQIQGANTQMLNQAKQINVQNKMEAGRVNLQTQMGEENINAANIGASQTARDAYLANVGTMFGERARDIEARKAQTTNNENTLTTLNSMGYGVKWDVDANGRLKMTKTGENTLSPENYSPYFPESSLEIPGRYDPKKLSNLNVTPYSFNDYKRGQ
jgi:hypothetical protein